MTPKKVNYPNTTIPSAAQFRAPSDENVLTYFYRDYRTQIVYCSLKLNSSQSWAGWILFVNWTDVNSNEIEQIEMIAACRHIDSNIDSKSKIPSPVLRAAKSFRDH